MKQIRRDCMGRKGWSKNTHIPQNTQFKNSEII